MPSRPKSVVIDGIYYAPVDVTDASALSAEMRGKRALRLQAEVERLRGAIQLHRQNKTAPGPTSVNSDDRDLWAVLDA